MDSYNKEKPRLNKKQLAVVDDLFIGKLSEQECLAKHNVSTNIFRKWLDNELFTDEITFRIEAARRQSTLLIARFAPTAAAKLVSLTDSAKEETARKACLDIIQMPSTVSNSAETAEQTNNELNLPVDTAKEILSVLANKKKEQKRK